MRRARFAVDRHVYAGMNADLYEGRGAEGLVVIKILRDFGDVNARRAFTNQVRVLARGHDGALPLVFADAHATRPFYVMPLLERGNLARHSGRLIGAELRFVAACIGSTLAAMHRSFDVHGDVKPQNALVDGAGRIWLSDPIGNPVPPLGLFVANRGGTPGYWAPEIRAGGSVSAPGDVYSFGATIWHLATGHRPVDGQRFDADFGVLAGDAAMEELIVACCQQDPNERPSMTEAVRILNGERWPAIKAQRDALRVALAFAVVAGALFIYMMATDGVESRSQIPARC